MRQTVLTAAEPQSEQPDRERSRQLSRLRDTAYRILTLRAHTCAEITRKLSQKGFPDDLVGLVVADLVRLGYLNDAQFARQWAASKARSRGFGRYRIEQELKRRGIAGDIVVETLRELADENPELATASRVAEVKLRSLGRYEPNVRRRRLAGFLERKGFGSAVIAEVLRTALSGADAGD